MAKTSNIFARVEPNTKEQAEKILDRLGIPMSSAIDIYLRQIIMHRGIPFDMKLPEKMPLQIASLSEDEFNQEIEKGFADLQAGRVSSADDVAERMRQKYDI